jgi:PIN domain nuclease of toxin-antitoxin system
VRVLLDTHVLLWLLLEPTKLSKRVRSLLSDTGTEVLVSSATAWEIATKHRLGKLEHAAEVVQGYSDHLRTALATELSISSAHALLAGSFKNAHKDPFDRLLASQSTLEGIPLVSNDRAFDEFPVTLFW